MGLRSLFNKPALAAFLLSLGISGSLWGAPSPDSPYYSHYQSISADLAHDIEEFDGLPLSQDERKKLASAWVDYLRDPAKPNPALAPGSPLSAVWPPKDLPAAEPLPALPRPASALVVKSPKGTPHSIHQAERYASHRLGPTLSQMLKEGKVDIQVYGGELESLVAESRGRKLERIPSFYDAWGIEKFLDVTPGQSKPRVIIRIPPIEQYVQHYGQLVLLAGGHLESAKLNPADREKYRSRLKTSVASLYDELGQKPDYVVLGYGSTLREQLEDPTSRWEMIGPATKTAQSPDGKIGGTLYNVRDRARPEIQRTFMSITAQETIWGEGSAFLADAVLSQRPRGIVFLGSAGSLGPRGGIYDVTVPSRFSTSAGPVPISNDLEVFKPAQSGARLHFGLHHGHTNSPAEQTLDYTTGLLDRGVETIDVEQSLVAKAVADYNRAHHADVTFAAANLVTDKPSSRKHAWSQKNDLAHVDPSQKAEARRLAVSAFLNSVEQRALWEQNADELRKQGFLSAIPGVDPAMVHLQNGQGKIDADPKRKLSYYIHTPNPRSPESRTLLIPMATSRFDEFNYQTDEWWDAHKGEIETARKNGTPAPRQDRREVRAYLQENGLSTNPDVFAVDGRTGRISREPLQEFLLKEYLSRYSDGQSVVLYRGAEKPGELASWKRGEFPRGARYWTPDATYAWRYGRKNPKFLDLLVQDEAPLFKFKVPRQEFIRLVRSGHLILGTELTKRVHDTFAREGRFLDQLNGFDYLGDGKYGLEFEVRADRYARARFPAYFAGPITIDDLADTRIRQIRDGTNRLTLTQPDEVIPLRELERLRIANVEAERKILKLVKRGAPTHEIEQALQKLSAFRSEISNIDGVHLSSFAKTFSPDPRCVRGTVRSLLGETHP